MGRCKVTSAWLKDKFLRKIVMLHDITRLISGLSWKCQVKQNEQCKSTALFHCFIFEAKQAGKIKGENKNGLRSIISYRKQQNVFYHSSSKSFRGLIDIFTYSLHSFRRLLYK